MPISQKNYVNIISQAGGGSAVARRDLMGRVFSDSVLLPIGDVMEFVGGPTIALESVGEYFGLTSAEYQFAQKYFAYRTKKGSKANKISFARLSTEAKPATVVSSKDFTLSELKSITNGELTMNISGTTVDETGLNFSGATSFADIATILNTAFSGDGISFEYNETLGRFVGSTTATGAEATIDEVGGDVMVAMGFTIISNGADAHTAAQSVIDSANVSTNFFGIYVLGDLTSGDVLGIAQWVNTQNVKYMYSITVSEYTAESYAELLKDYDGICLTLGKDDTMAGFMPIAGVAATNYNSVNGAIDMMYQYFDTTPSVTTNADKLAYDALKVNYYGQTEQAGNYVSFYQNGVLQGSISKIGIYANEAWLKDAFVADILNLRLSLDSLPANQTGVGMVMGVMTNTINQALENGVMLAGKTLNQTQKDYITNLTGDDSAWQKVQMAGYYLTAELVQDGDDYKVSFLCVYSKGDSINFVDGTDILI